MLLSYPSRPAWARAVLVWLLLAFTAALASPLVHPKSTELLCSGTGSVKLLVGGTDDADSTAMAPDCALCMQASAPPPAAALGAAAPLNLPYALLAVVHTVVAWRAAPPLPARGPPVLSA